MQQIASGYRGLSLIFNLNWDRLLFLTTLAIALLMGGFLGSTF